MNKQLELEETPIGQLLFKYSIPAIIGMLVNALYNVVDRMFIGNIPGEGNLAITGVGLSMPITTIIMAFSMLVGIGATANISIKLGEKKKEEAEKVLGNSISLASIIGIVLMIAGLIFIKPLLNVFGGDQDTVPYGVTYCQIILVGVIFNVLGFVFTNEIRADGNPKISAVLMMASCILNISLDAIFIFIFNAGIQGAALATIIAQIFSAGAGLFYFTKGSSRLKLKRKNLKLEGKLIKEIIAIGAAPGAMQLAISVVQMIMNIALKQAGGGNAIGAMAAISSITMIVLMPIFGINQGSQPIIGYNYGAKLYYRSKATSLLSMKVATIILVVGFIALQVFPETFIGMFNGDSEIRAIGKEGLRLYAMTLPIVSIPVMGSNYFQSIGKAKVAILLSLSRQVIILIPTLLILSHIGGLTGVWLAQPVSDAISAIIVGCLLWKKEFNHNKYCAINDKATV